MDSTSRGPPRRQRGNRKVEAPKLDARYDPLSNLSDEDKAHVPYDLPLAQFLGRVLPLLANTNYVQTTFRGAMDTVGVGSSFRAFLGMGKSSYADVDGTIAKFPENEDDPEKWNAALNSISRELAVLLHAPIATHPGVVRFQQLIWRQSSPLRNFYSPGLLLERADLGNLMDFQQPDVFSLRFEVKLKICLDIASAIEFLHDCGILHGDIKPENVLLFSDSGQLFGIQAKISDFGHVAFEAQNDQGRVSWRGYTFEWAAPEVLAGSTQSVDLFLRSDMFSYGLLFWHVMLEQQDRLPFRRTQDSFQEQKALQLALKSIPKNYRDLNVLLVYEILCMTLPDDPGSRAASMGKITEILKQVVPGAYGHKLGELVETARAKHNVACKLEKNLSLELVFNVSEASASWPNLPKAVERQVRNGLICSLYKGLTKERFAETMLQVSLCSLNGFGQDTNYAKGIQMLVTASQFGSERARAVLERCCKACGIKLPEYVRDGNSESAYPPESLKLLAASSLSQIALADCYGLEIESKALEFYRDGQRALAGLSGKDLPEQFALDNVNLLKTQLENNYGSIQTAVWIRIGQHLHTLLHFAAAAGASEALNFLLELGADVDELNQAGESALFHAMKNVQADATTLLLSRGANIILETSRRLTPLHYLSGFRNQELQTLIAVIKKTNPNIKVDVDCMDYEPVSWHYYVSVALGTPLYWSINRQNIQAARYLLELGADPLLENGRGCTALTYIFTACMRPFLELVIEPQKPWSDRVRADIQRKYAEYATCIMSEDDFKQMTVHGSGFPTARKETIELFQQITGPEVVNGHLLWRAVNKNRLEDTRALLEGNSDIVDFESDDATCLGQSIKRGNRAIFDLLMTHKPDLSRKFVDNNSYLHVSLALPIPEEDINYFVTKLLEAGADIHAINDYWMTSVFVALYCGQTSIATTLLSRGATLSGTTRQGLTILGLLLGGAPPPFTRALHIVTNTPYYDRIFIVDPERQRSALHTLAQRNVSKDSQLLHECRAGMLTLFGDAKFLNWQDSDGCTALHLAAAAGNSPMVRGLLEAGADKTLINDHGETALDKALERAFSNERSDLCSSFEGGEAGRSAVRLFDQDTADVRTLLESNIIAKPADIDWYVEQLAEELGVTELYNERRRQMEEESELN